MGRIIPADARKDRARAETDQREHGSCVLHAANGAGPTLIRRRSPVGASHHGWKAFRRDEGNGFSGTRTVSSIAGLPSRVGADVLWRTGRESVVQVADNALKEYRPHLIKAVADTRLGEVFFLAIVAPTSMLRATPVMKDGNFHLPVPISFGWCPCSCRTT